MIRHAGQSAGCAALLVGMTTCILLASLATAAVVLPPQTCAASGGSGSWPAFQPAARSGYSISAGNHRAVIVVSEHLAATSRGVVTVDIPWRRHDPTPQLIDAYIVDAQSHIRVTKCTRIDASLAGESATFTFLSNGPGEYHVYYMPFSTCELTGGACRYGAHSSYTKRSSCADASGWWTAMHAIPDAKAVACPATLQSRSAFASFGQMGFAATEAEVSSIVKAASSATGSSTTGSSTTGSIVDTGGSPIAIAVVEDRVRPLRMRRHMPAVWATRDPTQLSAFTGTAQRGEAYTFQVAIWAVAANVSITSVTSTGTPTGPQCMNFAGSDYWGRDYSVDGSTYEAAARMVEKHQLLPLWFMLNVSADATVGATLHSDVTITLATSSPQSNTATPTTLHVTVDIVVEDAPVLTDSGDSEAWRGTRLAWLNSKRGIGADAIPQPFTPIVVHSSSSTGGVVFALHDKNVSIGHDGLPRSIIVGTESVGGGGGGNNSNTANAIVAEALSAAGVTLELALDAALVSFTSQTLVLGAQSGIEVSWSSTWESKAMSVIVNGSIDVTGFIDYVATVAVTDSRRSSTRDHHQEGVLEASLVVASAPNNALMAMGLGVRGGYIDELKPISSKRSEWLILDYGRSVSADYLGIYGAGDGVHDPQSMQVFTSTAGASGPWVPAAVLSTATSGGAAYRPLVRYEFKFGDQEVLVSRYWRILITAMEKSSRCAHEEFCQAWIGEVQLRDAKTSTWITNTATSAKDSIVVSSSGGYAGNEAWKAADGDLSFVQGASGWDAEDKTLEDARFGRRWNKSSVSMDSDIDDSPVVVDWSWDGQNGNNGAWVGSSAAGVRLFLKGESDLWQVRREYRPRSVCTQLCVYHGSVCLVNGAWPFVC